MANDSAKKIHSANLKIKTNSRLLLLLSIGVTVGSASGLPLLSSMSTFADLGTLSSLAQLAISTNILCAICSLAYLEWVSRSTYTERGALSSVGASLASDATIAFDLLYLACLSLICGTFFHSSFFMAICLGPVLIAISVYKSIVAPMRAMVGQGTPTTSTAKKSR